MIEPSVGCLTAVVTFPQGCSASFIASSATCFGFPTGAGSVRTGCPLPTAGPVRVVGELLEAPVGAVLWEHIEIAAKITTITRSSFKTEATPSLCSRWQ
jgi:hypothetical protein